MSARVAIVDYDMGNLLNVQRACTHVGLSAEITASRDDVERADAVLLPGVGAFRDAIAKLHELGLVEPLRARAGRGQLLVGICLGLQLLFEESEEFGRHEGLGLLPGRVVRFPNELGGARLKVPHVGWSPVLAGSQPWTATPLEGITDGEPMYFVHSYYAVPSTEDIVLSRSRYGSLEFCSAVRKGSVLAFQFHPERSGPAGIRMYEALSRLIANKELS